MKTDQSYDMNQEKELMQTSYSALEYLAPKVNVVEVKALRVMCQSPVFTGMDGMENEDGEW